MKTRITQLLAASCLIFAVASSANAALVFSVTSQTLTLGGTTIDTEIRVSGGVGDNLQYFAIQADVATVTGGKTLNVASNATLNGLTSRTASPYVFSDRGQATTGAGTAVFVTNASVTSVQFRDGVSVPAVAPGGSAITNAAVTPGSGTGLLVAKLRYTLTSGVFALGDKFQVSLTSLAANANNFSTGGPGSSFAFTGAGTGFTGSPTGTDLGGTLTLTPGTLDITAVPEPSTFILLGLALSGAGVRKLAKRKKV